MSKRGFSLEEIWNESDHPVFVRNLNWTKGKWAKLLDCTDSVFLLLMPDDTLLRVLEGSPQDTGWEIAVPDRLGPPQKEPELQKFYPAIVKAKMGKDGMLYYTSQLHSSEEKAKKVINVGNQEFVRLATELPAVLLPSLE